MLRDEMQMASGSTVALRHEQAMRDALAGRRTGVRAFLPFFGPAVIASIAYMDPAILRRTFRRAPDMAMRCSGFCWLPT